MGAWVVTGRCQWEVYLQGISSVVIRYASNLFHRVVLVSFIPEHLVVKLVRQSVLASGLPLVTDCQASYLWLVGYISVIVGTDDNSNEWRATLSKPFLYKHRHAMRARVIFLWIKSNTLHWRKKRRRCLLNPLHCLVISSTFQRTHAQPIFAKQYFFPSPLALVLSLKYARVARVRKIRLFCSLGTWKQPTQLLLHRKFPPRQVFILKRYLEFGLSLDITDGGNGSKCWMRVVPAHNG